MIDYQKIKELQKLDYLFNVNCWGSTQFVLGVIPKPLWQSPENMQDFLDNYTELIEESSLRVGDILCYNHKKWGIQHTALHMGESLWWHKPGVNPVALDYLDNISATYLDREGYSSIEYRRFNKEKWDFFTRQEIKGINKRNVLENVMHNSSKILYSAHFAISRRAWQLFSSF